MKFFNFSYTLKITIQWKNKMSSYGQNKRKPLADYLIKDIYNLVSNQNIIGTVQWQLKITELISLWIYQNWIKY